MDSRLTDAVPVVDSHAHFWSADHGAAGSNPADEPVSPSQLVSLMTANGVSSTLQVTRYFEPDDSASIAGAQRFPTRFRVLARTDSRALDLPRRIRGILTRPMVVGLRIFDPTPNRALFSPAGDWIWQALAELDRPASIYLPGHSADIADVAGRHPDVRIVVDHAGVGLAANTSVDERFADWDGLLALAQHPNVLVKASALPEACDEPFPYPTAQERLRELATAFGSDRVMWGSNFTPCARVGTYDQHVRFARLAAEHLAPADRTNVLSRTAADTFGLPLTEE